MSDPLAAVGGFFDSVNRKGPVILGRVGITAIGVLTIILGIIFLISGSKAADVAVGVATKGLVKK